MARPFHICFAVPDLEQAMDDFTEFAGVRWQPIEHDELDAWSYRVAMSADDPFIELIEGPPGSPWDASQGPRFDHVGWWCADLEATARQLGQAGHALTLDGRVHGRRFTYHQVDSVDARFEFVDVARRRRLMELWGLAAQAEAPADPVPPPEPGAPAPTRRFRRRRTRR
jgi:catechol 2,3-dioxygenase-like lactoylglutathione lyase family enzyme